MTATEVGLATAGAAGVIGAAGEIGNQVTSTGTINNMGSVVASGVGNAIGAVTGGKATGPVTSGIKAMTARAGSSGINLLGQA